MANHRFPAKMPGILAKWTPMQIVYLVQKTNLRLAGKVLGIADKNLRNWLIKQGLFLMCRTIRKRPKDQTMPVGLREDNDQSLNPV